MSEAFQGHDVVVVGGGTAGCAAAARLARDGASVLVLEAGPDYGARRAGGWPEDLLDAASLPASHDWGYRGLGHSGHPLTFERCRAIGGCSSHFGTTLNSGWAGDYDDWAQAGNPGWDAESLVPEFQTALSAFEARSFTEAEIQPFHRAVLDSSAHQGLFRVDDFVALDGAAGAGCSPVAMAADGTRINAAFAYLDPQRVAAHLTVVGEASVHHVLLDGDRVRGVRARIDGRDEQIKADTVLLCAGTFGTPEILLRSGIGPAAPLTSLGIPVAHSLDGVGRNLHDQPAAVLEFEGSAQLAAGLEAFADGGPLVEEQSIVKLRSPYAAEAPFDLHLYPWVERDAALAHGWRCVIPVALLRPVSRGALTLGGLDLSDRAHVDMGYLRAPIDLDALVWGVQWARRLIEDDALSALLGDCLSDPGSDEQSMRDWIRRHHRHYWHPVGTCRMGPEHDPLAVVDSRGRVHGLDGLRVGDASVFPDVPRGTTALPTATVGQHIAGSINADLS